MPPVDRDVKGKVSLMKSFQLYIALAAGLLPLLVVAGASANSRHVVSPGDTLSSIAQVYMVTLGDVVSLNNIPNPDLIFPGQELLIPGKEAVVTPDGGGTYTVQDGDTLSRIASRLNVTTGALAAANGIENWDLIVVGSTLNVPGIPGEEAVAEADHPFAPLAFPEQPYDPEIEALIEEFSYAYGVDPRLVKALATVESGWNQYALSWAGAQGVMQIMPGTGQWLEEAVFGYQLNEDVSAYDNIKMGVKYLSLLLDETGGDEHLAVASYYQGLSPTQQGVFYPDTEDYVQMIMRVRDAYF
jgi:LysM repeat protein